MNVKQLATAQTVTSPDWIKFTAGLFDCDLTFSKTMDNEHCVLLFGSNADTAKWYQPLVTVSITIGKRGGIKFNKKTH